MKTLMPKYLTRRTTWKTGVAVLSFVAMYSAFLPALAMGGEPGAATSLQNLPAPQGVKILAQVPLQGVSATRMFTQWEHGRAYLYIEQGSKQITTVDITKTNSVRVVAHQPEPLTPTYYEPADGGPIEVIPQNAVKAGVDNGKDASSLTVLQADDPRDAQLLRYFGYTSSNVVDRDRRLVFFASPTRLLVLEDNRWYGVDYIVN